MAIALPQTWETLYCGSIRVQLSAVATAVIRNPSITVYVSSLTAWELGIKRASGEFPEAQALLEDFHGRLSRYGFLELPFSVSDALRAARLSSSHKDPFDRGLSAQALERGLALVSVDALLDQFGITRVW